MTRLRIFIALFAFVSLTALNAQDYDDTNIASHSMTLNVPEVSLLDIYDTENTGEATTVALSFAGADSQEAGLYSFANATYSSLWLNYTSIIANDDASNKISVKMTGTFPAGLTLNITKNGEDFVKNGGVEGGRGVFEADGVALSAASQADVVLVQGIKTVYTGDGPKGFNLKYDIEQTGEFSAVKAGDYTATITYTLSGM